jgi:hypothetical protein
VKWGVQREGSCDYLKAIKQPALVVNGNDRRRWFGARRRSRIF